MTLWWRRRECRREEGRGAMALEMMSERRHFLCTSGEARCTFGSAALLTAIIPVLTSPRPVINTLSRRTGVIFYTDKSTETTESRHQRTLKMSTEHSVCRHFDRHKMGVSTHLQSKERNNNDSLLLQPPQPFTA